MGPPESSLAASLHPCHNFEKSLGLIRVQMSRLEVSQELGCFQWSWFVMGMHVDRKLIDLGLSSRTYSLAPAKRSLCLLDSAVLSGLERVPAVPEDDWCGFEPGKNYDKSGQQPAHMHVWFALKL